jgi:hypothetical protein
VFSITKSKDGMVMKGMLVDARIDSVFWCGIDEIAKTSTEENASCANCGTAMENIGWIEYDTDEDKVSKMLSLVKYHSSNTNSVKETEIAKQVEPANNEGGVDVAEETEATVEATDEVVEATATEEVEEVAEETAVEATEEVVAPEAADVSEVEVEEPDFAKMFGDLQAAIETGLTKNRDDATTAITEAVEKFEATIGELVEKHKTLTDEVTAHPTYK